MNALASEFVPGRQSGTTASAKSSKPQVKNKEKKSPQKERKPPPQKGSNGGRAGRAKPFAGSHSGRHSNGDSGWQRSEELWGKGKGSEDMGTGQSASDLLAFKYYEGSSNESQSKSEYRKPVKNSWQQELHNKQQFMQANFRFEIRQDCVEKFHESRFIGATGTIEEADRGAHWDDVACVHHVTLATDPVTCPICLEVPLASKITKCGHIFCWPCMLHYLALAESNWRRCPMCLTLTLTPTLTLTLTLEAMPHV